MAEKSKEWLEFEEAMEKKLWHQLTIKLLAYVEQSKVQKTGNLLKLYSDIIQPVENKIKPFSFVKIASYIADQYEDPKDTVEFLRKAEEKVKADKEAFVYCRILQGEILLQKLKNQLEARKIVEEAEQLLLDVEDLSEAHSRFYFLSSQLYRVQGNYTEYYKFCLKYLGSVDLESVSIRSQMQHAFLLALAALLSKDIYNIGELLMHPVLNSLRDSRNHWVVDMLEALNIGDIETFENLTPKWSQIADIEEQKPHVIIKLKLMCFVEMAFQKQTKDRRLTFDEIATKTVLSVDEVELLIMKAISVGLIKGKIDQVSRVVHVTWIQPRCIQRKQIRTMINQLEDLIEHVKEITNVFEKLALPLINK